VIVLTDEHRTGVYIIAGKRKSSIRDTRGKMKLNPGDIIAVRFLDHCMHTADTEPTKTFTVTGRYVSLDTQYLRVDTWVCMDKDVARDQNTEGFSLVVGAIPKIDKLRPYQTQEFHHKIKVW
jgi:hypothetical protein